MSPRTHHLPAALVAVLATALLVAAPRLLDDRGRFGAVLLLQLVLVGAWVLGVGGGRTAGGPPAGTGTAVVGVAAAVGADLALELPHRPALGGLLAVLGPALLALVLDQMLRRSRRDMVAGLASGVLLVCAVTALAVLLLLARSGPAAEVAVTAVLAVGAALVVGHLVDLLLPRPQLAPDVPCGLTGLLLAVVAAVVVSYVRRGAGDLVDGLSTAVFGAVLGAVAALVALAGSYLAAEAGPVAGRRAAALPVVQALLPFAACAPIALALQTAL